MTGRVRGERTAEGPGRNARAEGRGATSTPDAAGPRPERLVPRDYFREALSLLSVGGPEALTITALCERLSITKGSFYHHFAGMPGFVTALLEFWERAHVERLVGLADDEPDARRRVPRLTDLAVALPHDTEAAFRAWARSSAEVDTVQRRVDDRRERHVVEAIRALGHAEEVAVLLGRMSMAVVVGVQQLDRPVDREQLRRMLEHLNAFLLAGPPAGGGDDSAARDPGTEAPPAAGSTA